MCFINNLMSETIRQKFTKADVIKNMMKAEKKCFGALLETKKEKVRREKLESKGVIAAKIPVESTENGELSWTLQVANNRIQRITIRPGEKSVRNDSDSMPITTSLTFKKSTSSAMLVNRSKLPKSEKRFIRKIPNLKPVEDFSSISILSETSAIQTEIEPKSTSSNAIRTIDKKIFASPEIFYEPSEIGVKVQEVDKIIPQSVERILNDTKTAITAQEQEANVSPDIEIKTRVPLAIISPPENFSEIIDNAPIFDAEEDDSSNQWYNTRILSVSRTVDSSLKFPSVTRILKGGG